MNNEHLVPVIITDLIGKLNNATTENERSNRIMQLEAIAKACQSAIASHEAKSKWRQPFK